MNYNYLSLNPRYKEKGWSLEIRRIEVGDRVNNYSLSCASKCDLSIQSCLGQLDMPSLE